MTKYSFPAPQAWPLLDTLYWVEPVPYLELAPYRKAGSYWLRECGCMDGIGWMVIIGRR